MDSTLFPVMDALLKNQGLQKISDAASLVLDNPFWIVDMNSNYMTRISGETHNPVLLEESHCGYVKDTTLHFVSENQIREKTISSGNAFSFQAYQSDNMIINCPVKIDNIIVAYISVIDENRPFTQADYQKMENISLIVSTELQKDTFYRNNKEMQYSYFLSDLLENHIKHTDINTRLKNIGYYPQKHFYLLTVELENIEARHTILHTIQEQLHFILPNCIYCLYEKHFIFLFSTEKELVAQNPLYQRLKRFLIESKLKAAISDSFRNLLLVPRNYVKTLDSIRIGKNSMPEESLYHYYTLVSYHAIDILKGIITPSDFCNKAIDKLIDYDTKNHKELTLTLYRYLEHNSHIVPTAEAMEIHSNTLRQRLDKIREIIDCNLDNGHQIFDLMMALKLYYAQEPTSDNLAE